MASGTPSFLSGSASAPDAALAPAPGAALAPTPSSAWPPLPGPAAAPAPFLAPASSLAALLRAAAPSPAPPSRSCWGGVSTAGVTLEPAPRLAPAVPPSPAWLPAFLAALPLAPLPPSTCRPPREAPSQPLRGLGRLQGCCWAQGRGCRRRPRRLQRRRPWPSHPLSRHLSWRWRCCPRRCGPTRRSRMAWRRRRPASRLRRRPWHPWGPRRLHLAVATP